MVHLYLGDADLAGVDADGDGGTVGTLGGDLVEVDDILLTVDSSDLALLSGVAATDNDDLVVLADGETADVVLVAELLGERSRHEDATDVAGGVEVGTTVHTAGAADLAVVLHIQQNKHKKKENKITKKK